MLAYDYPLLGVFWTMAMFFLWAAWFVAAVCALLDNVNDTDRSGWAKALWSIAIIVLPLLGVFLYLATRSAHLERETLPHNREPEVTGTRSR